MVPNGSCNSKGDWSPRSRTCSVVEKSMCFSFSGRTSWNKCVTLRFIHLRHRHTNFSIAIHQETIWAIQLIKRDKNPTIPTQNWKFAILNSKLIRCGNALFLIFTSSFPTPAFFKIKKVQFEGLWERLQFF